MLVPNRHGSSSAYRYGFQGQEKDDELKGEGNSLNYTFRMHDPRVGRFFAVDPLTAKYPWYTPYQFSGNKVIQYVELEGLEEGNTNTGSSGALDLYTGNPVELTSLNDQLRKPDINLQEVVVTGALPKRYTGYTADVDPYAFTGTKEEYIAEYGYDTYKNYSSADRAKYIKERTRDKWTPAQADAFNSAFAHGGRSGTYADPLVGILAIGVAPIPIGMFGAPATLQTMLVKAGVSFTVQGAANGKVNFVAVGSDALLVPGASAVTGSAFEANYNFKTGNFSARSIFGSGVHSKSIESFTTEASIGFMFGSANGYFGKIAPKYIGGLDDTANRLFFKGLLESTTQSSSYGIQSEIGK